jgi:hypothetical protein
MACVNGFFARFGRVFQPLKSKVVFTKDFHKFIVPVRVLKLALCDLLYLPVQRLVKMYGIVGHVMVLGA